MKNSIIPAVHLFLRKGNTVLLSRRFNTGYEDGNWSVIAGHVESGEFPLEAMIREAKEEAGILLDMQNLTFSHVMHRISETERVDYFFVCDTWENEPQISEPHKCDAMEWFEIDSIPENTVPYIRQALENIVAKNVFSERRE